MKKKPYRKINHLRSLSRAFIILARKMGYNYKLVPGDEAYITGGYSTGADCDEKLIEIGRDLSPEDRVIFLAHELGHVLDFADNPVTAKEYLFVIGDFGNYSQGQLYYDREKKAWAHGKRLLVGMNGYKVVEKRFRQLRTRCLAGYYKQMKKHAKTAAG